MEFNALTLSLQNFIAVFSGGYARLSGPVHSLLAILVGIEVVLLGLWTALGGGDHVVGVFKKLLHIGLWVWIVQSFPTLAKAFVESLIDAGLMAGGRGGDVSLILDPSRVAGYGLDATEPLAKKLQDLGSFDMADLLVFGLAYVAIIVCYLVMAINIFLSVLEYYLFVACVGILLPFGLVAGTRFLAERAIGAVVGAGIKLMVLSFITATIEPVLTGMHFKGPDIAMNELWAMLLSIGGMTLLCCKAPHMASSLLAGSPSLGGGGLVQGAMVAGGAVASLGSARAAAIGLQATQAAAGGGGGPAGPSSNGPIAGSGGSGPPAAPGPGLGAASGAPAPGRSGAASTLVMSATRPATPSPLPTLVLPQPFT